MKVVLVTKIKNLGNIGDIVDVKSGFARNFLLPYHKALPATDEYIKDFEEKKEEYLKKAKDELSLAEANAIHLEDLKLTISANAQESGALFGSVGVSEVLEALHAEGHDFEILQGIDFQKIKIKLICVEMYDETNKVSKLKFINHLKEFGGGLLIFD